MGSSPSVIRSSVQYNFACSCSSEAKSSTGRHFGSASSATTEKPASASLQASVPPPAPVPTMTKSTASSSRYSRIGTQPPTRNTSGARPRNARGSCIASSDTTVLPHRFGNPAVLRLDRLPRIAPVEIHPHVAARPCRSAEADLAPGLRIGVVGIDDVVHQALGEEQARAHFAPGLVCELSLLRALQKRILLRAV